MTLPNFKMGRVISSAYNGEGYEHAVLTILEDVELLIYLNSRLSVFHNLS
jgi:hypothetical protein